MKTYRLGLVAIIAAIGLLLPGCWRPTESNNPAKPSSDSAVSPQAPIAAPADTAASQVPAPAKPKKSQKTKQTPKPPAPAVQESQVEQAVPVEPVTKPERVTIPAGTLIPIRMIDAADSRTDQVGQTYHASIDTDMTVGDQIVVPKGSDVRLKLTVVTSAGKLTGKSELQLEMDRIVAFGASYVVVSNAVERSAEAEGPKTARDIGIGAAIGAVIGAIAGGKKGAAIGAGVGAGSGVAVAAITKGEQVIVPSESRLEFRLEQPLEINVMPRGPTD